MAKERAVQIKREVPEEETVKVKILVNVADLYQEGSIQILPKSLADVWIKSKTCSLYLGE